MKGVANAELGMMDANVFAAGGVQLVPNLTWQLHARLRWVFPHGKKWSCLSSILRLDPSRHHLRNPNSEYPGDEEGARGTRQRTRNCLRHRAQMSI